MGEEYFDQLARFEEREAEKRANITIHENGRIESDTENFDDDYDETDYYGDCSPMESFGCCLDDCVMPGLHFPSECHNSQMMEEMAKDFENEG